MNDNFFYFCIDYFFLYLRGIILLGNSKINFIQLSTLVAKMSSLFPDFSTSDSEKIREKLENVQAISTYTLYMNHIIHISYILHLSLITNSIQQQEKASQRERRGGSAIFSQIHTYK